MVFLITGGKSVKMLKTDDDANPTNYLFSFILVKHVACLYTLSTLVFRTGFLATVEGHCNVPFDILSCIHVTSKFLKYVKT